MCIYTRVGSETESHPRGSLNHFHGAFLPSFLWPIILLCLVLSLKLVHPPPCVLHLLAKMYSSKQACVQIAITPFLTSKESFCACAVRKFSYTLRMRNIWQRDHSLLLNSCVVFILEQPSTGDNFQTLSLGPVCFLPHTEGLLCAWYFSKWTTCPNLFKS